MICNEEGVGCRDRLTTVEQRVGILRGVEGQSSHADIEPRLSENFVSLLSWPHLAISVM